MMRVIFYVHDNLTAAKYFYKTFLRNVQNLNAANIFQKFDKNFHAAFKFCHEHLQILCAIKTWQS